MTKEDKTLLLKDLCARLPYGVKIGLIGAHKKLIGEPIALDVEDYENSNPLILINSNWLPYLRPMSSMTDNEKLKYITLTHYNTDDEGKPYRELTLDALDWLNENIFDYRGLIPMGLALEAPEDMYNLP